MKSAPHIINVIDIYTTKHPFTIEKKTGKGITRQ